LELFYQRFAIATAYLDLDTVGQNHAETAADSDFESCGNLQ